MESPVAIEHESRCASETLWMVWRKVSLSVSGIEVRFLGHPAPGLVTILNTIIRRLLLHFYLAIISRSWKARKACLANCARRLAVGLIPLTLRTWDGKLRFVAILSQSTKMPRWIKNINLCQYSVGPWTSHFLVFSGVFIVLFTTLTTGLIHVNCCFIYCRST